MMELESSKTHTPPSVKTTDLTYSILPSSGNIIRHYSTDSLPMQEENKHKQFTTAKKLVER